MAWSAALVFGFGFGLGGGGEDGGAAGADVGHGVVFPVAGEVEGHRDRARRARRRIRRPARPGRERPAWRSSRRASACVLGLALGEPDVVVGHGAAVPLLEVGGGPVDQGGGVGELPFEGLLVGLVGDEDRAGQAGVSLAAGLQRRQQAPAVGQDPVGAVEQVQASWSSRENVTRVPSALSLTVARNACSACSSRWAM